MACSPYRNILFLLLLTLCCGCDRECHCPEGCTHCGDCWCDCCGTHAQSTIVQIILPEGATAESFHLSMGNRNYDFYGNAKAVRPFREPQDILVYNNDGETVVTDGVTATTHTGYEREDISFQPTPFYRFCARDTLLDRQDTVKLYLTSCVKTYRIHVRLTNNSGKDAVTGCSEALVKGLASRLELWSGERTGSTSHQVIPTMKDNEVVATLNTWGKGATTVQAGFLFHRSNRQSKYIGDITRQLIEKPEGGDIYLTIDAERDLTDLEPATDTEGFQVGTEDWNQSDTTIDI